ncbi:hypothetical protein R3W88_008269 [Solanum pinnatisectum]|uniref:Amino acid transporter transmembrane domain-containing protein n=1 Tax=Solanum pinnatisectum TaxID=50273 RepID=A0AAV9M881_9SOLN|nr:hypothetical protein R3W88_008269 [Solanum pinnatisectum]
MMKNSVCEESFYIESEEEEYGENESDFSDEDNNDDENNRPNYSLTSVWPQSYSTSSMKSMDLYSNVSSPSLDFLGAPSLSQLGSSFFGSSLIRTNTPEILPSLHNPLIPPPEEEKAAHKHISHDEKPSKDAHKLPISRQSSYGQAVVNGMNVLCGVGILSTPYAVKEGGWAGLPILFIFETFLVHDTYPFSYCCIFVDADNLICGIIFGGVIASVLVVLCVYWAGLVDHVGFESKGTVLNLPTLPVAIGLYGFCFGGHAVVNPFTKYALILSPVAMSLEELLPPKYAKSHMYPILIRTALTISTSLVGLAVPFFGAVTLSNLHLVSFPTICVLLLIHELSITTIYSAGLMLALTGSLLTMLVTLILPCVCFLKILKGKISHLQVTICVVIITIGTASAVIGSYSALSNIIQSMA